MFEWFVVDRAGGGVPFANSSSDGLVITSTVSTLYITAPPLFLGPQFRSYGQRLNVEVSITYFRGNLISRKLFQQAYFVRLKFRDLAKKIRRKAINVVKIVKILICINKLSLRIGTADLTIAVVSNDTEQNRITKRN